MFSNRLGIDQIASNVKKISQVPVRQSRVRAMSKLELRVKLRLRFGELITMHKEVAICS